MEEKGISQREFIKFCTAIAATLSMPYSFASENDFRCFKNMGSNV